MDKFIYGVFVTITCGLIVRGAYELGRLVGKETPAKKSKKKNVKKSDNENEEIEA